MKLKLCAALAAAVLLLASPAPSKADKITDALKEVAKALDKTGGKIKISAEGRLEANRDTLTKSNANVGVSIDHATHKRSKKR